MVQGGDGNPGYGLTDAVAGLEALIGQPQISEDYVRFRIDVFRAQWEVRAALTPATPTVAVERDSGDRQSRRPALGPAAVVFDGELLRSLCDALHEAVARPGRAGGEISRLTGAAKQRPDLLDELSRRAAFGPDQEYLQTLSAQLEIGTDALLFVGRTLAAPFVAAAARRARQAGGRPPEMRADSGCCALCGSSPGLAVLEEDEGQRFLYCSLCGDRYGFRRLACPHCGTRESGALSYVRVNDADPRWIETCNQCNGYIKTIDTRKLSDQPFIPVVEETATLHLDLLAEREGCARGLPYAACV